MPLQVPSKPQVSGEAALGQLPAGSGKPDGTGLQVPSNPGMAHDWQAPSHAALQHSPCAHTPDRQSVPVWQVPPGGFLPQLPFWQLAGATQSMSEEQVARQSVVLHWKGAQVWLPWATQVPLPLQVAARVFVPVVQDEGLQTVSSPYIRQAPCPSQVPSFPQVAAASFAHPPLLGWSPTDRGEQVPPRPC